MFYEQVEESMHFIQTRINGLPDTGIVLGSGLGALVEDMEDCISIAYDAIPHFPKSTLEGHAGNFVFGRLHGRQVVAMQGRFHYYEGFTMKQVTYPIYVMKLLGVKELIVTNACGGINQSFAPGDLMIIDDFINSVCVNPLIGDNDERFGPRFPDMSQPYATRLRTLAKQVAKEEHISYQEGVYTFFQGPYYETAAEIRFYAKGGSDAIGMSTVPETIVANYLGMEVLGIACITNMATGICKEKHTHAGVLETANRSSERLCTWISGIVKKLS